MKMIFLNPGGPRWIILPKNPKQRIFSYSNAALKVNYRGLPSIPSFVECDGKERTSPWPIWTRRRETIWMKRACTALPVWNPLPGKEGHDSSPSKQIMHGQALAINHQQGGKPSQQAPTKTGKSLATYINYMRITPPLEKLFQIDTNLSWTPECQEAFDLLPIA